MATPVYAKYIAEFVGTYLLVFTIGCNVLCGSTVWGGTSIGCVLMVTIYALGGVSGANFNPAVSLALGLSNKLAWKEVAFYCIVQVIAGILAALSYGILFWKVFNLGPSNGFSWIDAGLAEALYSCMLCFVVLNTAVARKNTPNQFYGLAIGFVIIAGAHGAGAISGGCFNPAVAIGVDVVSSGLGAGWCVAYTVFECLGACLAAALFRVVRPDDFGSRPDYTLASRCVSEFVGTYFLVLTVGLNVLGKSPAPVWSIAACLMCMVFSLGNCSGAHFNPAVTLAIVLSGRKKCKVKDAGAFIAVQLFAGILAAFTYAFMHKGKTFALQPGKGYNFGHVAVAEIFATFVLCFVVLSVVTVEKPLSQLYGLAIASCVTSGGYAIGAVSGGSLNPAVSFGISSVHVINGGVFYNCIIYTVFELIGAALASAAFYVVRPNEFVKGTFII